MPDSADTAWTSNLPPLETGLQCDVAIVCALESEAAAIARNLRRGRKLHYGMFSGYVGELGGRTSAIIMSGAGERLAYVAARQIAWLAKPSLLVHFSYGTAVSERLRAGDVVLVRDVRRCFCPVVITDQMFRDDEIVWPGDEVRQHVLGGELYRLNEEFLESARTAIEAQFPRGLMQRRICVVSCGSMERAVAKSRGAEWVRGRFEIDVVDSGSYGFLDACRAIGAARTLALRMVCSDCTGENLRGRELRKAGDAAADAVELAVAAASASP